MSYGFAFSFLLLGLIGISCSHRIMFVALRTTSHEKQLLGLAEALVDLDENNEVFFATNDESFRFHSSSRLHGVQFLSVGPLPKPMSFYDYTKSLPQFLQMQTDSSISAFDSLLPQLRKLQPDALVFDALFPLGHALTETLHNEGIMIQPIAISPGTLYLHYVGYESALSPFFPSSLSPELVNHFTERIQNYIQMTLGGYGVPVLKYFIHKPFWKHVNLGQPFWPNYGRQQPLIAASVPGYEGFPSDWLGASPSLFFTGPFLPRSDDPLPLDLKRWIDASPGPVVYVSIGTNAEWTQIWVENVLKAFEDLPNVRVVWSTPQWQQDKYFSGLEIPSNIRVFDFLPQISVLQENKVELFVTHSGYSSVQESIWYGTKMIAMPGSVDGGNDQPAHAERVESMGLGIALVRGKHDVSAKALKEAIELVLGSKEIEENVKRWKKIFRFQGGAKRAATLVTHWLEQGTGHLVCPKDNLSYSFTVRSSWDVKLFILFIVLCIAFSVHLCLCYCRNTRRKKKMD